MFIPNASTNTKKLDLHIYNSRSIKFVVLLYMYKSTTNFIGGVSVVAESTSNFIVEVSVIAESTTNFIEVSNHHLNHILYIGGVCRREVFLFHLKAFFIHSSQSNNIRFMSIVYVVDYPHQVFVLGVGIEK